MLRSERAPIKLKLLPAIFAVFLSIGLASAQKLDPAQWSLEVESTKVPPGSQVQARLKAKLAPGWHLYSLTTPPGPIPTQVKLAESPAIAGVTIYQPPPTRKFDENFNSDTETFENEVTFILVAELAKDAQPGPLELTAQVRYQMCDDRQCLPPRRKTASASISIDPAAPPVQPSIPANYSAVVQGSQPARAAITPVADSPNQPSSLTGGLGWFLLAAFGFGLAAIFTPCVFPMIPITMSFFLNRQNRTRRDSVVQASVFCLGIIVLFTSLGAITTAALGPFGVVRLGSNPWVNSFIAAIFVAFALSLLGAFEITLPSGLLTKLTAASDRGGLIGTLLMGLTFCLTSFACVGPFVGSLLAASVQGERMQPLLGMMSFAAGLALPFFLLALFPSWLNRLPRSGGWMGRVKVVLGFVLLALALKYASNVDQVLQWNFLTRERFLAAWVVLFALPGLYLLGFLRLPGVKPEEPLGLPRMLIGAAFLIFAVSLMPGMFGGRLGDLDAYVPPPAADAGLTRSGGSKTAWLKNSYAEALELARRENKLVFVSFTGYACTNCHWMKANMFPRPEIQEALSRFVLVELYTDGTDEASMVNQELQEKKFSTVAIPYYAILTPDEQVVATFPSLTRNPQEFLRFLQNAGTAVAWKQ